LAARWQTAPSAGAAAPARRIISLIPALTEMLFAIGAGPQVVAVSSFDTYPPEVAARPKVGALLDPDVERVLSLRPDLVAIYGSQSDLRQQLQRAAIPIYDYRHAGLPDILTTIRDLGRVTGHAASADTLAGSIERQLAAIRARTATTAPLRAALVFGREPGALRNVYASGGTGFLNDMLTVAGGVNVFADLAQESVQATTELLLTRAPDVILELREGPVYSEARVRQTIAEWGRLAAIPAVKHGRIHVVTGNGLVVPGPRVAQAVARIARALHPEAFTP
ncbi:MAG TPA: helical backbone metal receptor, partial [Vicinamibacterales bacterium]|nr:helical backbone metal receptor [Vicinamibacterales bacterium]